MKHVKLDPKKTTIKKNFTHGVLIYAKEGATIESHHKSEVSATKQAKRRANIFKNKMFFEVVTISY